MIVFLIFFLCGNVRSLVEDEGCIKLSSDLLSY
jgi:hypothetical protein